jgi:hypothetical protein
MKELAKERRDKRTIITQPDCDDDGKQLVISQRLSEICNLQG